MDKENMVHIHTTECYSHVTQSLKEKRRNLAICNSMDLEYMMLYEIRLSERSKYLWFPFTWNIKNKANEQAKQNRLMDIENKLVIARVKRVVVGVSEIGRGVWDITSCYKIRKAKWYNV